MERMFPLVYCGSTQTVSMLNLQEINLSILFAPLLFWKIEVMTRTAAKFLALLLSCVALGSNTQGTHKEQNLLFVRHARGRKLESGVQKNRSIKPKIRWKAKGLPDVWQGQHQVLEVQQALISLTQEIISRFGFLYRIKSVSDFRKRFFYLHDGSCISSWEKIWESLYPIFISI